MYGLIIIAYVDALCFGNVRSNSGFDNQRFVHVCAFWDHYSEVFYCLLGYILRQESFVGTLQHHNDSNNFNSLNIIPNIIVGLQEKCLFYIGKIYPAKPSYSHCVKLGRTDDHFSTAARVKKTVTPPTDKTVAVLALVS